MDGVLLVKEGDRCRLEEMGLSQLALGWGVGRVRAGQTEEYPCQGRGFLLLGGASDGVQLFQLGAPRNHHGTNRGPDKPKFLFLSFGDFHTVIVTFPQCKRQSFGPQVWS